jgi:hypothetical protein
MSHEGLRNAAKWGEREWGGLQVVLAGAGWNYSRSTAKGPPRLQPPGGMRQPVGIDESKKP